MKKAFIKKWILFPFGFDILIYGIVRLLNDVPTRMQFWERPWQTTLLEFAGGLLIVYLLMIGLEELTQHFNRKTFSDPKKKIAYEVSRVTIYIFLVNNTIGTYLIVSTDNGMQIHDPIILNVVVLFFTLLHFVYGRAGYYLQAYSDNQYMIEHLAREKVETELKFLKSQVNPHFLFNSINNIYHLIEENKDQARDVLEQFSQMLRYQLYECNVPQVPLRKEITYLNNFVALQKIRFSSKLKVNCCFPEQVENLQIAPFLFLPLVENAFKHVGSPPEIQLKMQISDYWICFQVRNTIRPEETLPKKPSGIGLENLKRRLALLYPDQHELEISQDEHYFVAQLKVSR